VEPEPIVIKQFDPQKKVLEKGLRSCSTLVAFALVINIFLLFPVLFIEYTPNPRYLVRGL
jgi:hypothetical protein